MTRRASSRRLLQRLRISWAPHCWWARTNESLSTLQQRAVHASCPAKSWSNRKQSLSAKIVDCSSALPCPVQVVNDALLKGVSKSSLGGEALDASEGGGGGGLLTLLLSLFLSGGKMALVWDVVAQVVSSIDGPLVRRASDVPLGSVRMFALHSRCEDRNVLVQTLVDGSPASARGLAVVDARPCTVVVSTPSHRWC